MMSAFSNRDSRMNAMTASSPLRAQRAPAVEEIALHELLGQRAAALLDLPRAHVDEQRAQDRERVHAVVRCRTCGPPRPSALPAAAAALRPARRRSGPRRESGRCCRSAAGRGGTPGPRRRAAPASDDNRFAVETDAQLLRRLRLVGEAELADVDVDRVALAAERARAGPPGSARCSRDARVPGRSEPADRFCPT